MTTRRLPAGTFAAMLTVIPALAWAGQISGVVRSPSGSGRSGVTVTAIGATSWYRTSSGSGGSYTFAGIANDSYRVFFDPAPRTNQLAFQWNGGVNDPLAVVPIVINATTPTVTGVDATLAVDTDGDGLPDTLEPTLCDTTTPPCLNPAVRDTDGDGLADGDEVHLTRTSPLRIDSTMFLGNWAPNGIADGDEDLDGDLFTNAEELNDPAWARRTDPLRRDTDNDGLTDFEEVENMGGDTNPVKTDTNGNGTIDSAEDNDGDTLTNRQEIDLRLNPRRRDSDGDGIDDQYEDRDGDGLLPAQELAKCDPIFWGVWGCANPYDSDSDNDGTGDAPDPNPRLASALTENPAGPFGLQPVAGTPSINVTIAANQSVTINPTVAFGVDETATDSLALQVTVTNPTVVGYLRILPAGASPGTPITSLWFNPGESQTKFTPVRLGTNGDLTVLNSSGASQMVTLQLLGRFGRDAGTGHEVYRPALASSFLDTGPVAWTGTPPAIDLHPEVAIPIDPTGTGTTYADVERAVLLITHVPPAGATGSPFVVDVTPGSTQVVAPLDQINAPDNALHQRIISVKLDHGGGPVAQLVHRSGSTRLRVALIGYYVADRYYEAASHSAGDTTFALTSATRNEDLRGIDGAFGATFALLSMTARNATAAGTVSVGGITQLQVRPGATITNVVLAAVNATTGAVAMTFSSPGVQSVDVSYHLIGWFEHETYPGPAFDGVPVGARYTSLPAPAQIYEFYLGNTEYQLPVTNRDGVPARGVSQVMLAIQSWYGFGVPSAATDLRVWATGRRKPTEPQIRVDQTHADTSILVAEVGVDGKVSLQTSGVPLYAEISLLGWFTPYIGNGATTVAMVGDSITAGSGITNHLLGNDALRINSLGLGSHTTHDLRPWANQMGFTNPAYAIVYLGTNDAFQSIFNPIGHVPIDELRRYSTDHFPASTCVVYVAHPFLGGIDALAAEAPTRRSLIRFDLFQQQHEQLKVTPRFPTNPPQTYLKHVLQQYGLLASDGIHLSGTGNEALAMLYQYAVLGSTPGIGKTTFSPVVRYPNATVPDWSAYVSRTCS